MKALILTRVSTKSQEEGYSHEVQEDRCRKFCDAKDWSVVEVIHETMSGRKDLEKRALTDILERDDWGVLVVLKIDRLARRARIIHETLERIEKIGRKFASVEESVDTSTAMGWGFLAMIATFAEMESRTIGERASRGIEGKRQRGFVHLPQMPSGFQVTETRPDGSRVVEPDLSFQPTTYQQKYRFERTVKRWRESGPWILPPKKKAPRP